MIRQSHLSEDVISHIARILGIERYIKGKLSAIPEEARLDWIFETTDSLKNAIYQTLFSKSYDETIDISNEEQDRVNLYYLFFVGVGKQHFYFNEACMREDIERSKTLNDYCYYDYQYQQQVFADYEAERQVSPYTFRCSYWIRYIKANSQLVYATLRSLDDELYWELDELGSELIQQYIPHEYNLHPSKEEQDELSHEMITHVNGKDDLLRHYQEVNRLLRNELVDSFKQYQVSAEPFIVIQDTVDDRKAYYQNIIISNQKMAQKFELRNFESCINKYLKPESTLKEVLLPYIDKFKLQLLNELSEHFPLTTKEQ
ncbi:hypothetical protein [Colwellia sp. E2M01]|uniref:hypothetical protein n=1 Tax=Colwellia sp. E2M01 TaxID=2841561 RepID=UPI001C09D8DB|nr:hypothetical protein [Colwellia sp. E2M01]MBU2869732.1 hypothetical protein [Colwellia sp. E2M01]